MCELKDIIQEPVKNIEFSGFKCCIRIEQDVKKVTDDKHQTAIILEDPDDGEQVAVATICIPEENLESNEVIIKNYSENEGMLHTLILAKIISVPVRYTKIQRFPICKLLLPCPEN
jgi:hypothetical protein